jgi:putative flippase GtrA
MSVRMTINQLTLSRDELRRFAMFVVVGVIAALASLVSRGFLSRLMLFEIAVVIAQIIGLVIAFLLSRKLVFTSFDGSLGGAFRRFFVVNIFSLTVVTTISGLFYRSVLPLVGWTLYPDYSAHFIGLGVATLPAYFGHRFYSFRR